MPYGRYNRRRRMVAVTPKTTARKYTPRRKNYSKKPKVSFNAKVQKIIASNIENKITTTLLDKKPVSAMLWQASSGGVSSVLTYQLYTFTPASIFNITQGTGMGARIGNKIKIKRWVIKGLVQPNATFNQTPATGTTGNVTGIASNTLAGYVDIYFGRYNNNIAPVTATAGMTNFYQSGATDVTPLGQSQEQLYNVNKDLYHIYYHKRIKVGTGQGFSGTGSSLSYEASPSVPGANGFGLTKSFGFDVCKFICKNRILKYDELISTPQDSDIENLTLWAIFHPAAGDVGHYQSANLTSSTNNTFYDMNVMSYAEYEDA